MILLYIIFLFIIFVLKFNPKLKQGELWYNSGGLYNNGRDKIKLWTSSKKTE